jgi:uncharacterized membrane protein YbhN (UPF0104 family)
MLAAILLYAVFGHGQRKARIGGWTIAPPRLPVTLAQVVVGSADWIANAGVLYILLPAGHPPFFDFLGLFVTAYLIATFSNVPAGLGIFESIIIADLHDTLSAESVVSALLVYRAVYFLLPFCLAGLGFAWIETRALRRRLVERRQPQDEQQHRPGLVKTS